MRPIVVPVRKRGLKRMATLHAALSLLLLSFVVFAIWQFIVGLTQLDDPGIWTTNSKALWAIVGILLLLLAGFGIVACLITIPTLVWVLSTLSGQEATGLIMNEDGLDIRLDPFTRRIGPIPWSEISFIEYKPMVKGYCICLHFLHPEKYTAQVRLLDPVIGPVGLLRQGKDNLVRAGLPVYTALLDAPDAQLCATMAETSKGRTATQEIGLSHPWDLP